MKLRALGASNLQVSLVGLGCNNFGFLEQSVADAVVGEALELGVNLFDTADVYGRGQSETQLAKTLGKRRKDVLIATKFGGPMDEAGTRAGASARYIAEACEASLKRLNTDWIDLYQLHRPDPETPLAETVDALDALVRAGKVRAVGCSNLPGAGVVEANAHANAHGRAAFVCAQDNYSLIDRRLEGEVLPVLKEQGMGLLPYLPLASGMLTGKYRRDAPLPDGSRMARFQQLADAYMTDAVWSRIEGLERFARQFGRSLLELAMSWLAAQPRVASIIAGATKREQVAANVAAVSWALSADELRTVDQLTAR